LRAETDLHVVTRDELALARDQVAEPIDGAPMVERVRRELNLRSVVGQVGPNLESHEVEALLFAGELALELLGRHFYGRGRILVEGMFHGRY
jgi:hypothetical protein